MKLQMNKSVYWTDPHGQASGIYAIVSFDAETDYDSAEKDFSPIGLFSRDGVEQQAFYDELQDIGDIMTERLNKNV